MIRLNGGLAWLLDRVARNIHSSKGAETGVFLLTGIVNMFTANNTVAIIIAGPVARELSSKFGCDPKRIAGILDTASCFVQGVIPYGAQMLVAVATVTKMGLAISAFDIMQYLFYPYLLAVSSIVFILLGAGKKRK